MPRFLPPHTHFLYSHPARRLGLVGCLLFSEAQAELYRDVAPGGNFALENWGITAPQDADGGTHPQEVLDSHPSATPHAKHSEGGPR